MNLLVMAKAACRKVGHSAVRNAPHILMGIGTGAGISAVIFAAKATPDARRAIRDAQFEKSAKKELKEGQAEGIFLSDMEELTFKEKAKACWKFYIPAAGMEVVSLACFWGAHGIDIRRQAVLAGLCTTAEEALRDYQRKVREMLGTDTDKEIRKETAQDFVNQNPPPQNNFYIDSDTDRDMVFAGQYFRNSYYGVKKAENEANHEMIQNMYISESELMWLLDPERKCLRPTTDSGQIGWSVDRLITLDIEWVDGPKHQPIGMITVRDKDDDPYPAKPGYSRML